jgi:hypothetical protein
LSVPSIEARLDSETLIDLGQSLILVAEGGHVCQRELKAASSSDKAYSGRKPGQRAESAN